MNLNQVQQEAMRILEDRLAPIMPLLQDDTVNEIMINTYDQYFVEANGRMEKLDIELPAFAIDASIHSIMALNSKEASQIMDARLPGLRIACALPPVAIHGPMMVIRKHARKRFTLDDYVRQGTFDRSQKASGTEKNEAREYEEAAREGGEGLARFLRWAIRARKNILLAGGTSSGKTTLMSACLMEIPDDERIITCEDTNEITLSQPNVVQFEAYSAPGITITIRDLVRLCLRCRPDRIIVGEIRGQEAYDFLDALNTGHSGSLCTIHADSAFLALRRLESLVRMSPTSANLPLRDMRSQIANAIDYVIYQSRSGGVRAPEEIIAVSGLNHDGDYSCRRVYYRFS